MKKLTLSILMLGVMILMISGVSAVYERPCADIDICTWTTNTGHTDYGLPLGSEDNYECGLNYNTYWPINTTATATCVFEGEHLEEAMLYVSINKDIINCTLNDNEVFGSIIHEVCAPIDPRDGFSTNILSDVVSGQNTLVCTVSNREYMTHFDACIIGEYAPCEVIIDEPREGEWFDSGAVLIEWHLEGYCTPLSYVVYYQEDNCEDDNWNDSLAQVGAGTTQYEWNVTGMPDGPYCIAVEVNNDGMNDQPGYSEVFHLDQTPPETDKTVGQPSIGDQGFTWVTQNTPITLDCDDREGSGEDKLCFYVSLDEEDDTASYCEAYNGDMEGEYCCVDVSEYSFDFYFLEDTYHDLDFYCIDKVGKESEPHGMQWYRVDTVGPLTIKLYGEPIYPMDYMMCINNCEIMCGENYECIENCIYMKCNLWSWPRWISSSTPIILEAEDLPIGECTVGVDKIYYRNTLVDDESCLNPDVCYSIAKGSGDFIEYTEPFYKLEESCHLIEYYAVDLLGNKEKLGNEEKIKKQCLFVDLTSPVTTKWYEGPYEYDSGPEEYIDNATTIHLEAVDPEPHPSGVAATYYRYELVDESYCWYTNNEPWTPTNKEDPSWMTYHEAFSIEEESCHVIEYYSIDNVEKEEEVQWQFVFVDLTPPKPVKEVGEPSYDCHRFWKLITRKYEEDWDWIITMDTEIGLSCVDQEPHPSGTREICYRVFLDGELIEEQGANEEGYLCVPDNNVHIYFNEESEHLLEFYCVDNLDKTSEVNSELFKVEEEAFEIHLHKKWNLRRWLKWRRKWQKHPWIR